MNTKIFQRSNIARCSVIGLVFLLMIASSASALDAYFIVSPANAGTINVLRNGVNVGSITNQGTIHGFVPGDALGIQILTANQYTFDKICDNLNQCGSATSYVMTVNNEAFWLFTAYYHENNNVKPTVNVDHSYVTLGSGYTIYGSYKPNTKVHLISQNYDTKIETTIASNVIVNSAGSYLKSMTANNVGVQWIYAVDANDMQIRSEVPARFETIFVQPVTPQPTNTPTWTVQPTYTPYPTPTYVPWTPQPTPTSNPGQVLSSISVYPVSVSVGINEEYTFTATAKDQNGNTMNTPLVWSLSDSSVGTISSYGKFTGKAIGSTYITATSGLVSGSSTVIVSGNDIPKNTMYMILIVAIVIVGLYFYQTKK